MGKSYTYLGIFRMSKEKVGGKMKKKKIKGRREGGAGGRKEGRERGRGERNCFPKYIQMCRTWE